MKSLIQKIPGARRVYQSLRGCISAISSPEIHPRGHFYSPLPDIGWVQSHAKRLFRKDIDLGHSINLREDFQESLLHELSSLYSEFKFPETQTDGFRYYSDNNMFGIGSGLSLYAILRHFSPKRVIEVGSGFTSALMLDVNDVHLDGQTTFTFIEPYPKRLLSLLRPEDQMTCQIYEKPVQYLPLSYFEQLEENDILFIDSSHVSKIGSDVNYLLFNVLPSLNSGVIIHFHDIFWPFEYPQMWVMNGTAWNETYMVRAFLQYNSHFEILQFNNFLAFRFADYYRDHLPRVIDDPGSSLWIRKR